MSGKIFISYRRGDDSGSAGRLRDAMANRFGPDNVFFDVSTLRAGDSWKDQITHWLNNSAVLVVVIGSKWTPLLEARQASDLEDEHIFEIATAFDLGLSVVPVLLDDTPLPPLQTLPSQIGERLQATQAKRLRHDDSWEPMVKRLLDQLSTLLPADPAAPDTAGRVGVAGARTAELTVGPLGSKADFHEIADAVAAAPSGATIHVAAGRYLKPLVIEKNLAILVDNPGEATLECRTSPCIRSEATESAIAGLLVRSTAPGAAMGIEVMAGSMTLEQCAVSSEWPDGFVAVRAGGKSSAVILDRFTVRDCDVGIHLTDHATARITDSTFGAAKGHAVVIDRGADPQFLGCTLEGAGLSTVLIAEDGKGTISDCIVGRTSGATIEIRSGGDPLVHGRVADKGDGAPAAGPARLPQELTELRLRLGRRGDGELISPDEWTVRVSDHGKGRFVRCHLAELETAAGGSPALEQCQIGTLETSTDGSPVLKKCQIGVFRATDHGSGTLDDCEIDAVTITTGANPRITGGSKIRATRARGIAVTVSDGGLGVIENCEIVGRNIERRVADPAVRVDSGGDLRLVKCKITSPEAGTVHLGPGGRAHIEGCAISTDDRGAVIVGGSGATTAEIVESKIQGGVHIHGDGAAGLVDCEIQAHRQGGSGVLVDHGGTVEMARTKIRDVAGQGVSTSGRVSLTACDIRSTGSSSVAVLAGGDLEAADCEFADAGNSPAQRVGRRLGALSERMKERAGKLGPASVIRVDVGSSARFVRCTVTEERAEPIDDPSGSASFEDCKVNGEPYPPPGAAGRAVVAPF